MAGTHLISYNCFCLGSQYVCVLVYVCTCVCVCLCMWVSLYQRLLITNGVIWTLYVTGYSKLIQITQEIKSNFICRLKLKLHTCTILRFQEYCQVCFHSWLLLTLYNHGYVLHHLYVWSQWVALKWHMWCQTVTKDCLKLCCELYYFL